MSNALAGASSPYLRQHAGNPVDWLPWGEDALTRAAREDKPLLVSIGYAACHWCHVMARECFADEEIAALMNASFVCVKVDREERPDVDALAMDAVQSMTGQGGWPLHVFLTPEQAPFYGGTYFPPEPRHGSPSWPQVLTAVAGAWDEQREEITEQGARMAARLSGGALLRPTDAPPEAASLHAAQETLRGGFDAVHGGWGGAPKFPAPSVIEFLLRRGETAMSGYTLASMAGGGIYDHVGGGFARYAVDASWTVPHFEKMLSDNALLARTYLHAFQLTGETAWRRVCEETLDWMLRELAMHDGGFASSLDADSEGVEGRFYVWTLAELRTALGTDADEAIAWFGATAEGNFVDPHAPPEPGAPGRNVLEDRGLRPDEETVRRIRARLLEVRERRVRPARDGKRLTAWNALAISALADAGAVLGRADYVGAAQSTAAFVLRRLRDGSGPGRPRLLRSFNDGAARIGAFLEDHALLLEALLHLYEADFEPRWLDEARRLADELLERFADAEHGGFFSTAADAEPLFTRRKELEDQPTPAGGSSAALGLLRLAALTGEHRYEKAAAGQLRLGHELAVRHPGAFGHLLQALDEVLGPRQELAVVGDRSARASLVAVVRERPRPGLVVAAGDGPERGIELLAGRSAPAGAAAAFLCESFRCQAPVHTPDALRRILARDR
ncbi:MAG: thioredoxin domain-containing protein [Solirubrobacterales bacterium]|nr:thioredoxin domain-containing protein [Solirubrobacterales bacterium]